MYCDDLHCWKLTSQCNVSHAAARCGKNQPALPHEGRYLEYVNYCHQHVPGWKELPVRSLVLTPLLGGLSNDLFICEPEVSQTLEISKVVVRVYGPAMSILVDAAQERAISRALSKNGLGPVIYYEFITGCGRIEQFLVGKTLNHTHLGLPDVAPTIARYLAKFHAQNLDIEGMPKDSQVFPRMRRWLALALKAMNTDSAWLGPVRKEHRKSLLEDMQFDGRRLENEMLWLEKHLSQFSSPVVFCHNDLQEGNILRDEESKSLQVIDFEYGCYCERGFDLGNFFCEWFIDNQYAQHPFFKLEDTFFPTKEARLNVIGHYLGAATEQEVQQVEREAYSFMLASHLQWVVWGVLQAFTPQVETNKFDYIQYAYERWNAYLRQKASL